MHIPSDGDPTAHEGVMSSCRDRYVSNAALLRRAQSDDLQLHRYYR